MNTWALQLGSACGRHSLMVGLVAMAIRLEAQFGFAWPLDLLAEWPKAALLCKDAMGLKKASWRHPVQPHDPNT